jgi:hypothetical protein
MSYSIICDDVEFNINGIGGNSEYWDADICMMKIDDFLSIATYLPNARTHSLEYLKDKMKSERICPPLLSFWEGNNYKVIKHEGRHRATLCKNMGMEYIPVALHGATIEQLKHGFISQNNINVKPEIISLEDYVQNKKGIKI